MAEQQKRDGSKKISYDFKTGSFKIDPDYLRENTVTINQKDTVTSEFLTSLGHAKGMWKFKTEIIQFPNTENNNTCICKTIIGGYDLDPIENKIIQVEYEDIADANPMNCTKMVAKSFIRMASTRSQARALRKYTGFDITASAEMDADGVYQTNGSNAITLDKLNAIKQTVSDKKITPDQFNEIMIGLFNTTNFTSISNTDGDRLLQVLKDYVVPK